MFRRYGFTLMEMIVVLIIIGIAVAFAFPNFTGPTEQAKALNAQNNLLAIYSAEKNYYNNNNSSYCIDTSACGDTLAHLNANLSLNIQDDGTYSYSCSGSTCTATRSGSANGISVQLNAPIQLTGEVNPSCTLNSSWCP